MATRRERQVAKDRHERQQARRAAARARARRRQQVVAAVVAVLAVFGGVFALSRFVGGDSTTVPATASTPGASAGASESPAAGTPSESPGGPSSGNAQPSATAKAGGGQCTFAKNPAEPAAKDVGVPTYDAKKAATPYTVTLKTSQGVVSFEALTAKAPCTAVSFRHLAEKKYFDDTPCHRLTTEGIFVLQCGDPTGSGSGGPGYGFGIENAPADGRYPAGTVAMARSTDPDSNGSQFFLVYSDTQLPTSGGGYTVFGRVTKGLDVLDKIAKAGSESPGDGKPKLPVTITAAEISAKAGS